MKSFLVALASMVSLACGAFQLGRHWQERADSDRVTELVVCWGTDPSSPANDERQIAANERELP